MQDETSVRLGLFRGPNVGDLLIRHNGAGPGFDFWRFFLSSAVIFLHSFHVAYGTVEGGERVEFLNPAFAAILPIFFGLSGFLVAGSAIRTSNVLTFLSFRAVRLIPALTVEIVLSALILGPMLTTVPLAGYFSDHEFIVYWGNILGRVRYALPGLFIENPVPRTVNLNLWTLHAELECYAVMAVAMLLGVVGKRRFALFAWAAVTIAMLALSVTLGWFVRTDLFPSIMFVYSFFTGVLAFLWRDRIPMSSTLLVTALAAYLVCYALKPFSVLGILPLIYIMIWVGMQPRLVFGLLRKGDYSYGLYLYGFVIQQTLVFLLPGLRQWYYVFPATLALTLMFAVCSWHFVEKPALRLKKLISPRSARPAGGSNAHHQAAPELARLEAEAKTSH